MSSLADRVKAAQQRFRSSGALAADVAEYEKLKRGLHAEVVEQLGELFVGNAPIQRGN